MLTLPQQPPGQQLHWGLPVGVPDAEIRLVLREDANPAQYQQHQPAMQSLSEK
jgi:hypothetical protein